MHNKIYESSKVFARALVSQKFPQNTIISKEQEVDQQYDQKIFPNVYKSCLKMISLEK